MDQHFLATALALFDRHQPRRLKVVCGVADGDVTPSVMYWAMQYHLLDYVGCMQFMARSQLLAAYETAYRNGWLQRQPQLINEQYCLTAAGEQWLQHNPPAQLLNLGAYDTINYKRWRSFMRLVIQVVSEYRYANTRYYAAERNRSPQVMLKEWLQAAPKGWEQALVHVGEQMVAALPTDVSQAWVYSLAGHQFTGKTTSQLAQALNLSDWQVQQKQFEGYIRLSSLVAQNAQLKRLRRPFADFHLVSKSAAQTYTLYEQHYDIATIARMRRFRPSTIQSHLQYAKIADWQFTVPLLSEKRRKQFEQLKQVMPGNPLTWRFADVKTKLPCDFFALRIWQIEEFYHHEHKEG